MTTHEPALLSGTAVVVTGGGRGLGRAMTEALAAAGASVLIVDVDAEPIDEVCAKTEGVAGMQADVTDEDQIAKVVAHCIERFGSVDVIVNNAGIGLSAVRDDDRYSNPVTFEEAGPELVRRFLDVHVVAPYLLSRAAVPHMRERGWGRVVTVTTSLDTMLRGAPYGPAKAASEAYAAAMSHDLAGSGITVNVLIPGGGADTRYVPDIPGRSRDNLIKPAVMGPPMVYLASRQSDGLNASRIVAKLWDPSLPPEAAVAAAAMPIGWPSGGHGRP